MSRKAFYSLIEKVRMQPVLINIYWLMNGKIVILLGGFISNIFIANSISPNEYGMYNYAWSIIAIVSTVISLGLRDILIKELVESTTDDAKNRIISSVFYFVLGLSIICLLVAYCFAQLYFKGELLIIFTTLCFTFLQSPFIILSAFFESQTNAKPITIVTNTSSVISIATKICLAIQTKDIKFIAISSVIEMLTYSVGILWFSLKNSLKLVYFERKIIEKLLIKSFPLLFNGIFVVIYMKLNQLMINSLSSDFESGVFSLALKLSEVFYFIPVIVNTSIYPRIIVLKSESLEALEVYLLKWYKVVTYCSMFVAITISLSSDFIISTLYNERYFDSSVVLKVLIWTLVPVAVGVLRNSYIYSLGLAKIQLKITILGACLNLGLNFLLIPKYGAFGCAISLLSTQFFVGYIANFLFKDLFANGILLLKVFNVKFLLNPNK